MAIRYLTRVVLVLMLALGVLAYANLSVFIIAIAPLIAWWDKHIDPTTPEQTAREKARVEAARKIPVIGHLGGVPVSVPQNYIDLFAEYDKDQNAPEHKREEPRPERNFQSGIASLPLLLHLPDFKPELPENAASLRRFETEFGHDDWLRVGVQSNAIFRFRDAKNLNDPYHDFISEDPQKGRPYDSDFYQQLPGLRYGLTEYKALGMTAIPTTSMFPAMPPYWFDYSKYSPLNHHVFLHRTNDIVDTVIDCGVGPLPVPGGRHTCNQRFVMPEIKSEVDIQYTASLLPRWREFQNGVRTVILGFRISPSS